MIKGFQIRAISFHGQNKEPAIVTFGPGLNVIHGASNTGKSFIVEAIDFMLGGKGPLPDIPERVGYDRVLLSIENITTSEIFSLLRSHEGGAFRLFDGYYAERLPIGEGVILAETHSDKNSENLSTWLLSCLNMAKSRIRKNKNDDTISLSFRHLARLSIINEEEIIQKRSPLADGNYTADTANFSVFKFLLTGTDDSALVSLRKTTPEEMSREAQIDLLDELIKKYQAQIKNVAGKPEELEDQDSRLGDALSLREEQLSLAEGEFKKLSAKRRAIYKRIDEVENRLTEISTLSQRFYLLDAHYDSDLQRLKGIEEAGSLFSALGKTSCPVCGALPGDQHTAESCEGDVENTIRAARAEIQKIETRQAELSMTIATLEKEEISLQKRLSSVTTSLQQVSEEIREIVTPNLKQQRASYSQLSNKRLTIKEALAIYETLKDLELRKRQLIAEDTQEASSSNIGTELPTSVVDDFAEIVRQTLADWGFPNSERVYFDLKLKDLVIGGKNRTAYGKGLRAITQAAFTVSLMRYCKKYEGRHPGFVALDSPLLSYKAPENSEDDLSQTGLKENFYEDLKSAPKDQQFIIIENVPPSEEIANSNQVTEFTGTIGTGRFGLFPS
nr:AAA family ATPase [uncultured Cohaesibacter sp.]